MVVSAVWLPDNIRHYQLYYNPYGELARAELPTGGAFEYDYWAGLVGGHEGGEFDRYSGYNVDPDWFIYRRIKERRVYHDGTIASLVNKTNYSRPETYHAPPQFITGVDYVDVDESDASGRIGYQRHYYYGTATPSLGFSPGYTPTDYIAGKEWKTEVFDLDALTVLRRVQHSWSLGPTFGQGMHIDETITTLTDTNQSAKQTFLYDQFNNRTDAYEYDYSVNGINPSYPLRHTHIEYVTTNELNGVDYTANNVHLRGLPEKQWVYAVNQQDGSETLAAKTEMLYDEQAY